MGGLHIYRWVDYIYIYIDGWITYIYRWVDYIYIYRWVDYIYI